MAVMPRIALLADTYYEVNGVARTCREWEAFARRRQLPFLSVRWGGAPDFRREGSVWSLELPRGPLSVPVDPDLHFEACFYRQLERIEGVLRGFHPDFIHLTSPGDLGIAGAILAARLKTGLALSWHTNLHQFAGRQVDKLLSWFPQGLNRAAAGVVERFVLGRVVWFFSRGDLLFAPNPQLLQLLRERTGKPVFRMGRGIDTELFNPCRRRRTDGGLVLGFVGRLMPEKNLRLLPRVEAAVRAVGLREVSFLIVGAGSERSWLERRLERAEFTGVLHAEALASAYADMDVFVFPSRTDTCGNVVQEALASGVPAVVTAEGGPACIVQDGVTGLVASSDEDFCRAVAALAADRARRGQMAAAARRQMESRDWDAVFEEVYQGYAHYLS